MKKRGKRKRSLPLHAQHPLPELVTIDVESVSRIPIISNAFSNPFIKCRANTNVRIRFLPSP